MVGLGLVINLNGGVNLLFVDNLVILLVGFFGIKYLLGMLGN